MTMRLLVDASSVELFADDGRTIMTSIFFPNKDYAGFRFFAKYGTALLTKGTIYELNSAVKP